MPETKQSQRGRVVKDPLYGYINIPAELTQVVDHSLVQRLRRISQNSLASSVYPSLTGSRFEHALGTMHLAMLAWRYAWTNSSTRQEGFRNWVQREKAIRFPDLDFDIAVELAVGCVGLLHDVGHPPYSHALEPFYEEEAEHILGESLAEYRRFKARGKDFHEFAGSQLLPVILPELTPSELQPIVTRIYNAPSLPGDWASVLRSLISGEIDVDRLDYLMRDARRAGTEYGSIDYLRYLQALEIHREDDGRYLIGPGYRARPAAESVLVQRSQAYRWIYFHHGVVAADLCLLRALQYLGRLSRSTHPLQGESSARRVGDVFHPRKPTLDYISPGLPREADLGFAEGAGAVDLLSMLEEKLNQMAEGEKLKDSLQSTLRDAVDDATVLEWLKRGYLVAQILLARKLVDPEYRELQRFIHYVKAAIYRDKNFFPVWKSHEDYLDVAERIQDSVTTRVEQAYATLAELLPTLQFGRQARAFLKHEQSVVVGALRGDPAAALNLIAGRLLWGGTAMLADFLTEQAPKPHPRVSGFWDAAYRRFAALGGDDGSEMVRLRGKSGPLDLARSSPLVASLPSTDKVRMKLFTFYFRTGYTGKEPETLDFRSRLRDSFVEKFPVFVADNYVRNERELIFKALESTAGVGQT